MKARLSVPGDSSPPGRFATDLGVAWDLGPSQAVRHPREKTRTWKQFIKAHWDSLYACDFFSVETLGLGGTVRYMIFFVIELKTRAVEIAGIRVDPDGEWMKQMTRNLSDGVDGFLRQAKYLIHDRDPLFTEAFEAILRERGVKCVKIPAQSPNCSPHAERFVKTIRHECTYPAGSRAGCHPCQRAAAV